MDEGDLAELLPAHAARSSVPGAAIGIFHRGNMTTACFGVADTSTGDPVTTTARFSAGSLTKPIVATELARLARLGRLSLDDPVAPHVPEVQGASWVRSATVRDLMANHSGLPLRAALEFGFADRPGEDDGSLARLVAELPRDEASQFWSYTNAGWCVLGRVVETVTGQPFAESIQCLLDELGMRETQSTGARAAVPRVRGHEVTAAGMTPVEPLVSKAYAPAGTRIVTTVADLLRLARTHLDDPSLAGLRIVQSDIAIHGWLDAWGLGWARFDWDGREVWGWDGLVPGERAILRLFPQERTALVLLTNGDTGRAMYRTLFAEVVPALLGIHVQALRLDPAPGAAGDLQRFAGVYAWPDRRVEVTATSDRLRVGLPEGAVDAVPVDGRVFVVDAADPDTPTVTFGAFDQAGRPHVLYEMLWGLSRVLQ